MDHPKSDRRASEVSTPIRRARKVDLKAKLLAVLDQAEDTASSRSEAGIEASVSPTSISWNCM
jgi:hypothetical protein